jgi:putative oxidoreductase
MLAAERDGPDNHGIMSTLTSRWIALSPYLLSVLRIMAAFVFAEYGTGKLLAWPGSMMPGGGTAPLLTQAGIAGLLEMVGGGLLLVGLFTRPVAFLLSGEMAFAYFIGHAGKGFWPMLNGGAEAVTFCFLWLYISAAGGGPWSLDALLRRRP